MSLAPREAEQPRLDGETPAAARGTAAFGALYREHFEGLYDFVVRIVRDADLAGEIVQSTFTKAWDELRAGRDLTYPKAWLYTVARNQALDEVRRRRKLTDDPLLYAQADTSRLADPQAVAEDHEMVELVWASAAALNADEYSLLDLHVRHGFGAAELADALDLERGAVYTRLSRLRNSLEESVASTLLVRRGSKDCPELAAIIEEHQAGDAITPSLRKAVRAHVSECEICTEARRRAISPVALFGALVPILPVPGLQTSILGAIMGGGAAAGGAAAAGAGAGAATAARQGGKARYLIAGAGGVAAVAVVTMALSAGPSPKDPATAVSTDHTLGVPSSDNTVTMRWQPGQHAHGYSVVFSRNRMFEPPARENVTGTSYTSAPLAPGRWWFILRTHGRDGGWTHTLRVGPFVISAPATPAAKKKAKPAKHAKHAKPRHQRELPACCARPAGSSSTAVIVAGKPTTTAAPNAPAQAKPKQKPKPKQQPRPKKPKSKPPPAGSPTPTGTTTQPGTPPADQPTSHTPPVVQTPPSSNPGGDDGDHEHSDEDHQGQTHDHGDGESHGDGDSHHGGGDHGD
jgi:RNA polymerase sigma factor (sigma-70 family)